MIDFDAVTEVLVIYYVGIDLPPGDWMAIVYKAKGESWWTLKYRFRWYVDGKAFESDDRKNWYRGRVDGDADDVVATLDAWVASSYGRACRHRVLVKGDGEKALAMLAKEPWAHVRVEPIV